MIREGSERTVKPKPSRFKTCSEADNVAELLLLLHKSFVCVHTDPLLLTDRHKRLSELEYTFNSALLSETASG